MHQAADGICSATVPVRERAWLALVDGNRACVTPAQRWDTPIDLGPVALEPCPVFGTVAARLPDGTLAETKQLPSGFRFASGARLPASLSTGPLAHVELTPSGSRVTGLPLFAAIEIATRHAGHYAEPALLTLHGGVTHDARLLRGADLQVLGLEPVGLATLWLVREGSGERIRQVRASLDSARRPRHEFENLPPGDYTLHWEGGQVTPGRVTRHQ